MTDQYGRKIDYIRISVTDRCNLRCVYCMPEQGVESIPHDKILRFQEIVRICRVMARDGLHKVKITGGEPLVRKGVTSLIRDLKQIEGIDNITITTNGVLLRDLYDELVDAGIDAITVSLDTLDPDTYCRITRRDEAARVMEGIRYAFLKNRVPLKINCVPVLGVKDQQLTDIVEMARNHPVHIRFIEMMPIGLGSQFPFVKEDELRRWLEERYGRFEPCFDVPGNGPCHYYSVEGFCGRIGFISAVSHKFCHECNRIRLTAEGFLKTCLQYDCGVELKPFLEAGCSDEELAKKIREAIDGKPLGHNFDGARKETGREQRGMSQIGG